MKKAFIVVGISVFTLMLFYGGYFSEILPPQKAPADQVTERSKRVATDDNKSMDTLSAAGSQPASHAAEFAQKEKVELDSTLKSTMAKDAAKGLALQQDSAAAAQNMEGLNEKKTARLMEPAALVPPAPPPVPVPMGEREEATGGRKERVVSANPVAQGEISIAPGSLPAPPSELSSDMSRSSSAPMAPLPPAASPAPGVAGYPIGGYGYVPYQQPYNYRDEGRDKFDHFTPNPVKQAKEEPVSTFSIDVNTSSYAFMRSSLNSGSLPQPDAVRTEELINYFPYSYEVPEDREQPFRANVAIMPTPWDADTKLLRIGIKGYQLAQNEKPHVNLVFLLDTSGSMDDPVRLPLVVNAMKLFLDSLRPDDTVAIVTYAGYAGVALEPTQVRDKEKIVAVLNSLHAEGSTAGFDGLQTAYKLAEKNFDPKSINRVILSTDGDFNVGITDTGQLKDYVAHERDRGIFLSILGVGKGNYNDALMQTLAQNGNGSASYIDSLSEARKVLIEETNATLFTIAKDVKIQVEFNPAQVAEYRLIGYESRLLNREDFNNDKVAAGDVGAGHAVTALYEITPVGSKSRRVDDLRYQKPVPVAQEKDFGNGEYAFIKIRYKLPNSDKSQLISTPVSPKDEVKQLTEAPADARFAAAVAAFGQLLKGDNSLGKFSYADVAGLARDAKGSDTEGYRAEFTSLVELARHEANPSIPAKPEE